MVAGEQHACGLTAAEGVTCWGGNQDGQSGDGTAIAPNTPIEVGGLNTVVRAIGAGTRHTCVLNVTGGVKCWRKNHNGQLGNGSVNARGTPLDVTGLAANISAIAAGQQHSFALDVSGTLRCWGDDRHRGVNEESESEKVRPVEITSLKNSARAISAGGEHTCALALDKVHCWGGNTYGQLGKER